MRQPPQCRSCQKTGNGWMVLQPFLEVWDLWPLCTRVHWTVHCTARHGCHIHGNRCDRGGNSVPLGTMWKARNNSARITTAERLRLAGIAPGNVKRIAHKPDCMATQELKKRKTTEHANYHNKTTFFCSVTPRQSLD